MRAECSYVLSVTCSESPAALTNESRVFIRTVCNLFRESSSIDQWEQSVHTYCLEPVQRVQQHWPMRAECTDSTYEHSALIGQCCWTLWTGSRQYVWTLCSHWSMLLDSLSRLQTVRMNTLLSLVNAAGLSEQVTDSTYEHYALIGQCCWTLWTGYRQYIWTLCSHWSMLLDSLSRLQTVRMNTMLSLVNAAGLSEQVTDSTFEYSALIDQCCLTLWTGYRQYVWTLCSHWSMLLDSLNRLQTVRMNTLLSLVNAAGLSEQVPDSTYEHSALIGQCCWTLWAGYRQYVWTLCSHWSMLLDSLNRFQTVRMNTLLSLVNAAGLSEQVTDSTYEHSALIGQCCWTLWTGYRQYVWTLCSHWSMLLDSLNRLQTVRGHINLTTIKQNQRWFKSPVKQE